MAQQSILGISNPILQFVSNCLFKIVLEEMAKVIALIIFSPLLCWIAVVKSSESKFQSCNRTGLEGCGKSAGKWD